ncbi:hypothetical protein [Pilimelia terevasa]|uniref:hypothetical protein n=1 Tax=Pilimelia terevasa TaxID=53372 RepID=UPI001669E9EF|nr:hypothetical protein [Pilimelia terevasa]
MKPDFGQKYFTMQSDGNLVLYAYKYHGSTEKKVCWESGTRGAGARATYQNDGNFVIYVGVHAVWSSNTAGKPGASVSLDGYGPSVDLNVGFMRLVENCVW